MLIDSLIPTEMAIAPNPLGLMPNLKLKTVPVDAHTAFELWSPARQPCFLLPEEATLLRHDCARVEYICDRLTWLLSAVLMDDSGSWAGEPMHQWSQILQIVKQSGYSPEGFDVSYHPQVIGSVAANGINGSRGWLVQPAHWQISILQLKPGKTRYQVERVPFYLMVSLGEPITRCVNHRVA